MSKQPDTSECQRAVGQSSIDNEDHTDQHSKICGNKYYILIRGKTLKCHDDIIRNLQAKGLKEVSVQECDFIVVFCTIVSRAGTDIESALNELNGISESKPAIFVVFHHTFDPEKVIPDSSRCVNRSNTLTLDCLFHEDQGLLKCIKNKEALDRIQQHMQKQEQDCYIANWWPLNMCSYQETVRPVQVSAECSPISEQDAKLLEDLEELLKNNDQSVASELMIVLLGMSGSGKSAVGNMLLGRKEIYEANVSTQKITVDSEKVDNGQVTVIDTPDWFNSCVSLEKMKENIQRCMHMCSCGPYAVLLVISVDQFEEKAREVVKKMTMIEDRCWERIIILLTITKQEKHNIEEDFVKQNIQSLVEKCGERVCFLNIRQKENSDQVSKLLKMIEEMVAGNREISDGCEESRKLTTSEMDAAIKKSEQKIVRNYIKEQLDSQQTVWVSKCQRNMKTDQVLGTLKTRLSDCDEDYEML